MVDGANSQGTSIARPPVRVADVLLVDDNPQNLLAIEVALEGIAAPIIKARSGQEALRHLLTEDFALVLLDVQMPSLDGFETARLIRQREHTRDLPIIFITAFDTDAAAILAAYELGAVDFLRKPIIPEVLRAKASVFVALSRKTAEIKAQAEKLREHERLASERKLAERERQWQQRALRQRIMEERKNADELSRRAEELARTITDKEQIEKELFEKTEHLAEADRRKDEFIAVLAHELRNPLNPIVTGLELFRRREIKDPILVRTRDAMERQVSHITRLVDDLLDISRITAGKIELRRAPTDLCEIVAGAVASCSDAAAKRNQHIDLSLPEETLWVDGDHVRLAQIAGNLLSNAVRYSGDDSAITVSLAGEDDCAVLRVADDGRGIPQHMLDHIFEMFVQNQIAGNVTPSEGLGIGLTLVDQLVHLHGGKVFAASPGVGCGSVFTVSLPLCPAEELADEDASAGDGADGEQDSVRLTIVLVEDNPDIRESLSSLLETLGHEVVSAKNGTTGVEAVLSVEPDVALIDIGLPELDGYGVAEKIRAAYPEGGPRLVAMTGYGRAADQARGKEAGFHDYLVKPASFDALMRALHPK
ncbi:MAG TPA: response regulator [Kofleriaceae bacterium]|nr:response regulator [Kofleriaceae bacterium]